MPVCVIARVPSGSERGAGTRPGVDRQYSGRYHDRNVAGVAAGVVKGGYWISDLGTARTARGLSRWSTAG